MKISELISNSANVTISVSPTELREFALELIEEVSNRKRKEAEKEADTYLTANEVADKFSVSKPTLWRWDKIGYLKPVRVGRKPYYRRSDVEALLHTDENRKSRYEANNGYSDNALNDIDL